MNLDFVWDDHCINTLISDFSSNQIDASEYNDKIANLTDVYYSLNKDKVGMIFVNSDFYDFEIKGKNIDYYVFEHPDICKDTLRAFARTISQSIQYEPEDAYEEDIYNTFNSSADCYLNANHGGAISSRQIESSAWWNDKTMYKAENTLDLKHIYRNHIKNSLPAETVIWEFSNVLWSNLYFHPKPPRLSNLKVCLNTYFELIMDHLSYLNDHAFDDYEMDQSKFVTVASSKGVELSGESANTRGDNKAMNQRKIKIENHDVTCELHTKITYNKGRIHFNFDHNLHSDVLKKIKGKVIIGMLVEHLKV
jgi:hypothetical protein